MQRYRFLLAAVLAGCTVCAQTRTIDFRFAPGSWFTAICFPGDWQKSVVTNSGSLGCDFGPGPYARPFTEMTFGIKAHVLQTRHVELEGPRVPLANAELADDATRMQQTVFAVVPTGMQSPSHTFLHGRLERFDGLTGTPAWASPGANVDPAFCGAAWGVNRPLKYRIRVAPGSTHTVVLGLCEPYKPSAGKRVLVLKVEGASDMIADPVHEGRPNTPYVYNFDARDADNDGWIEIEVHASIDGLDPNVVLNAIWMFADGFIPDRNALIRGTLSAQAEVYWRCGTECDAQPEVARDDALFGSFPDDAVTPTLIIRSRRPMAFDSSTGSVWTEGRLFVTSSPVPVGAERSGDSLILEYPRGTAEVLAVMSHGGRVRSPEEVRALLPSALERARQFWQDSSALPYGGIVLPDSATQMLLDANIRNLYAIAEPIDGFMQFEPGPSVYRGLWVHDAVWHNLAAAFLGDTRTARTCIEAMLRYQRPDGHLEVMAPYPMNRETPLLIFLMGRYALLSHDRTWLESHWGSIQRGVGWLWELRRTTLKNPHALEYGLFPPGFSDGGLAGLQPEYGSVYWSLAGLLGAAESARWLGHGEEAALWEDHFWELLASFRRAARRDQRVDRFGNTYLPMKVGDTAAATPPQLANWGILDAQGLGHVFAKNDSLVGGTLRMLQADLREGLPPNTGWLRDGVWPFFGTLEAIAHLYADEDSTAVSLLYAVANHASPTWTWVEEQLPRDLGTKVSGDGSNATASALFIQLIRQLIIFERDSSMDLLAGVPPEWYHPGAHLETHQLPTIFGPCNARVDIAEDQSAATVFVAPMLEGSAEGPVALHLRSLRQAGYDILGGGNAPDVVPFVSTQGLHMVLTRSRGR